MLGGKGGGVKNDFQLISLIFPHNAIGAMLNFVTLEGQLPLCPRCSRATVLSAFNRPFKRSFRGWSQPLPFMPLHARGSNELAGLPPPPSKKTTAELTSTYLLFPYLSICQCGYLPDVKGNNPPSSFFENIVNNFHNTVFHSLFRNTNYFPN